MNYKSKTIHHETKNEQRLDLRLGIKIDYPGSAQDDSNGLVNNINLSISRVSGFKPETKYTLMLEAGIPIFFTNKIPGNT